MQISVPVAAPVVSRAPAPAVAASDASPAVMLAPLTSLRFFAAAMIVVSHAEGHFGIPLLHDPAILMQGVSFFFVLSGFILAYRYPMLDGKQSLRFFVARVARLWPLYILSTVVWVILVPAWVQDSIYQKTIGTTLANLFLVQTWVPYSAVNSSYNLVAWSISTEMFFYLCFPLLIRRWHATWHWKMLAVLALALGMICVSTFAAPHLSPEMRSPYSYAYDSPLTRLWEFTVGIGAAMLWRRWHPRLNLSRRRATALEVGVLCLAVGVMVSAARIGGPVTTLYYTGDALTLWLKLAGLTALPFALLIAVMALGRGLLSRLLGFAPFVLLGEISYAMYLLHDTFINWVGSHVRPFNHIPVPVQGLLFIGAPPAGIVRRLGARRDAVPPRHRRAVGSARRPSGRGAEERKPYPPAAMAARAAPPRSNRHRTDRNGDGRMGARARSAGTQAGAIFAIAGRDAGSDRPGTSSD